MPAMQAIKKKWKKATSTPKGKIITLSILSVIFLAIIGGIWYWNAYKKAIIRRELEKAITKSSKGLYRIRYDDLSLDEINGSLTVKNMFMAYDSTKFNELEKKGTAPSVLVKIQIPEINVTGVKTPRVLIEDEIVGKKLEIKNPTIDILYTHTGRDSTRNTPTKEVYEQILGNMDLIKVDSVLITGAQINTRNSKNGKANVTCINISIVLTDVQVDSTSNADTTRILFAKTIDIACQKLSWASANKMYSYSADSVLLNSARKSASVKSFRIIPAMGEEAFVRSLPTQDDRFDFSINNIDLTNMDWPGLFDEKIVADSVHIGSASFKIYRDLGIVRDKKNRVGTYPHQAIQKIPLSVQIGKLVVAGCFVEYKERNAVTRQAGRVQFNNVYAVISNFTNNKEAIEKNNVMTADINSRFLNQAPLHITWLFYLQNPKGRFDVKGSLGAMDATSVNPLSEPMGPARIEEGKIRGVDFDLKGHDYGMDGQVRLLYDDLKVTILKKDEDTKKLKKKGLASFAANLFIKNSNPKKNEKPRVAEVHFDRDTNRSIFHLSWKTLFKGIKETVGVNK
jgi:hypothetical protein